MLCRASLCCLIQEVIANPIAIRKKKEIPSLSWHCFFGMVALLFRFQIGTMFLQVAYPNLLGKKGYVVVVVLFLQVYLSAALLGVSDTCILRGK